MSGHGPDFRRIRWEKDAVSFENKKRDSFFRNQRPAALNAQQHLEGQLVRPILYQPMASLRIQQQTVYIEGFAAAEQLRNPSGFAIPAKDVSSHR